MPVQPIRLILLLFAAVIASGCASDGISARVPYTDRLLKELQIGPDARPALQYYLSRDIHLVRAAVRGDAGVSRGRLISDATRVLDEVIIERGSPGVVVGSGRDWLAVSFAPGTYLYFVSRPQANNWLYEPDAISGRYYLYARNWRWNSGTVWLGDRTYQAVDDSRGAFLLVDREDLAQTRERKRVLPGRWLYQDSDYTVQEPWSRNRWR